MSAVIYRLADFASRRPANTAPGSTDASSLVSQPTDAAKPEFCFWQGVSGNRYVHHVFALIDCPQVRPANYLLVRREASGARTVLHVGQLEHGVATLNLAELRFRGANVDANEVHLHFLADDADEREMVALDLAAGLRELGQARTMSA